VCSSDLLTPQIPAGAEATYQLDGSADIQSNKPTVTISPGVTATLLAGGTTTITVQTSTTALSNAFAGLATAYNKAKTEVNNNHGQNAQALEGQSIILELADALHNVANYTTGNSGISSLTSLGFSFDQSGMLSFDPTAFATATRGQTQQLASFLGSTTTGGFLEAASNIMTGLEDPTSGIITGGLTSLASQITAENNDISDQQDKISQLQTNLTNQMSQADATIATMEQQFLSMQTLFTDMQQDQTQIA
jgi:flagellar capping protein FliD